MASDRPVSVRERYAVPDQVRAVALWVTGRGMSIVFLDDEGGVVSSVPVSEDLVLNAAAMTGQRRSGKE